MSKSIVELGHVSVTYNGLHVIKEVNLEVVEGDFIGILGPNGGGKTTVIRVILGLVDNCCGTVKIFGETICTGHNERRLSPATKSSGLIGYVPQNISGDFSSFPGTVSEVVATGLANRTRLFRRIKDEDHQKIEDVLHLTGIHELKSQKISDISGGQRQRTFIARALVSDPKLLILDEPTSGVDTPSQTKFYSMLEKFNKKLHISVLLSSHDMAAISKLANKLVCINKNLFYHGNLQDFFGDDNKLSELYGYPVRPITHLDHR